MKKMMMVALVMMVSGSVLANNPAAVKVLSKAKDVVYFKVSCEMVGASLVIYDEAGNVIHSDVVTGKKMIVDFYAEPSGSYKIHVVKNGSEEVIEYNKLSGSHAEVTSQDHISVTAI